MISLYGGAVASVMGVLVAWNALDLDRPAFKSEVDAVYEFASETREISLNQEWFRVRSQLEEVKAQLAHEPLNRQLIERRVRLEQQLRAVEAALQALRS